MHLRRLNVYEEYRLKPAFLSAVKRVTAGVENSASEERFSMPENRKFDLQHSLHSILVRVRFTRKQVTPHIQTVIHNFI